jgi:hypothetical protein
MESLWEQQEHRLEKTLLSMLNDPLRFRELWSADSKDGRGGKSRKILALLLAQHTGDKDIDVKALEEKDVHNKLRQPREMVAVRLGGN